MFNAIASVIAPFQLLKSSPVCLYPEGPVFPFHAYRCSWYFLICKFRLQWCSVWDQTHTEDSKQRTQLLSSAGWALPFNRTHIQHCQDSHYHSTDGQIPFLLSSWLWVKFILGRHMPTLPRHEHISDPLKISRKSLFLFNTHACTLTSSSLHLPALPAWYLLANRHKHLTVTGHPWHTYTKLGPPAHQLVQPQICYQITQAQTPVHTKTGENHKHSSPPNLTVVPHWWLTLRWTPALIELDKPRCTFIPVWLNLLTPNPLVPIPLELAISSYTAPQ